jgi:tRNA modification GTPase
MDTAGIRETSDEIEQIGIEKSRASVQDADLVFFVMDGSETVTEEDREIAEMLANAGKKTIVLLNKQDLLTQTGEDGNPAEEISEEDVQALVPGAMVRRTQLLTGAADEARISEVLEELLRGMVYSGSVKQKDSVMITGARHEALIGAALTSLKDALARTQEEEPLELIEIDVHEAYDALGEIIGEAVAGDVVDQVFARFCLGK